MNINYIKNGDYELPNLTLKNKNEKGINKYGLLRLEYLKASNKPLYITLLMRDELTNHLISVSKISEERYNNLMSKYIENDSLLTEKSKENNQLEWAKKMNYYRNLADEIIINEIINSKNV